MATYKANHLKAMIREVVREEIREVVSSVISEVLAEKFLRQLAESAVASRPRGVSDIAIQGDEEEPDEDIPGPLDNHILGVGQEDPVFKKVPKDDHVRQHGETTDREGILSLFFEGTKPLAEREGEADEGIPIPLDEKGVSEQARHWGDLVKQADQLAEARKPMQMGRDAAAEEERLKRKRAELDAQVVR